MNKPPTFIFLLHDIDRLLQKRFEQRDKSLGLPHSYWQALASLNLNEGIHQSGLAEILAVHPFVLVRILDKLEQLGLVERRRHPGDRRTWHLYLRQAAHPLLAEIRDIANATWDESLDGLPDDALADLLETLTLLKTNLIEACHTTADDRKLSHG
jgi:MarR family transcriptional regulator for hemolysin